ncbi:MAG: GAF domain-containing sensor histidine kinase [Nitriliruptor sp.]
MSSTATDLSPADEAARIAAVRRYDILDTPPDGAFDRVTALAARICKAPISTITIVDEDRIWFKSAVGLDGVDQIDREPGLCSSAIVHPVPYVVTDASIDPRTLSNSLVCGDLGLRFYVAIPLTTSDGYSLGTLNVIDREPREVSDDELDSLRDLAAIVVDELQLRLAARHTVEYEALQAATEFRDTIVAGLSHELRTPVAVLQGLADLGIGGRGPAEQAERIDDTFRRQVRHLGRLVEQFLDHAALEHGRVPAVRLVPTDLSELLAEVVDLHADRGAVTLELADALPLAAVDPERTHQIVSELIVNARRFGPPDGRIVVRAEPRGDAVAISVTDEGPGISAAAQAHIFEKYHSAPTSTGSGLGLHVARALAEAQGATIELERSDASGSRFTLTVDVADGQS